MAGRRRLGAEPKHGYLYVRTKMLKRLFSCAKRLGALSHSTRVPEENTSTCSASKMEETRCCVRRRETSGQRRKGKKVMRVRRGNWVKKCSRQRSCIYSELNRVLWHKQRQKGHFCVSVALNDSLQYRLQWLKAYNILMSQCVNAKRLIVTDYQLSEVVKKDKNRERIEDVKAWQALKVLLSL